MSVYAEHLSAFITESNKIEGILDFDMVVEMRAYSLFLLLPDIKVADMSNIVNILQPGARLRDEPGMDVTVGDHRPRAGCPSMKLWLTEILLRANRGHSPFVVHNQYESLHPFMDGNGRSGRLLWAWQMCKFKRWSFQRPFLLEFYWQALQFADITPLV
jgi:hypothetical protein